MVNETDLIRERMAQTRSSISHKLDHLERHVFESMEQATTAVADTAASVKDTVQGAARSVHEMFDPNQQVERHPWTSVAVSVGIGFAAGSLIDHALPSRAEVIDAGDNGRHRLLESNGAPIPLPAAPHKSDGWLRHLLAPLEPDIRKLKELGVGMAIGVVRDMLSESAPDSIRSRLTDVADDITVRLGGKPVPGPVLGEAWRHGSATSFASARQAR